MFFSIIVPTCNRHLALSQCLSGLSPEMQKIDPASYEVIVTDDSADESQRSKLAADFPGVLWQRGPRRGPAANRNSGTKAARGKWLLFIDDDCLPQSTLLSAYREAIANHEQVRVFEGATLQERPQARIDEEAPINIDGGYCWSCNLMIQRDLFCQLDGFCELFPFAALEDSDLYLRLQQRGEKALFVPMASVIHPWRRMTPPVRFMKMQIESHLILFRRHPDKRPAFSQSMRLIGMTWIKVLFVEALRLRCRGLGGGILRVFGVTWVYLYLIIRPGR